MPEYLAPGVYVEEVSRGPKAIEGVSTSTAGFLGETERGPTTPTRVTSYPEFTRRFGGVLADRYLAYSVEGFFRNGGERCFVGRVTAEAETATATPGDETRPQPGVLRTSRSAVTFDDVVVGDTAETDVLLTNLGDPAGADAENPDVAITAADLSVTDEGGNDVPDDGVFQVDLFPPGEDPDDGGVAGDATVEPGSGVTGNAATLRITYAPTATGRTRATLTVPHDGENSPVRLALDGRAVDPTAGELAASSERVSFTRVVAGHRVTETLSLTNRGDTADAANQTLTVAVDDVEFRDDDGNAIAGETDFAFELYAVDADPTDDATQPAGAGESVDVAPGESAPLVVSYTAGDDAVREATLHVPPTLPDDSPGEALDIALTGTRRDPEPGEAEASQSTVEFGAVTVGHTAEEHVVVTNLGHGDPAEGDTDLTLAVDDIGLVDETGVEIPDGGEFTVEVLDEDGGVVGDGGVVSVDPGESVTLRLRYTPSDVNASEATVTLPFGASTVSLTLVSQGVVFEVRAVGPGRWGGRVALTVDDATLSKPDNQLFALTVSYWRDPVSAAAARSGDGPDPDETEVYDNLSPVEQSSDYFGKRIDGRSAFVETESLAGVAIRPPSVERLWLDAAFPETVDDITLRDFQGLAADGSEPDPGERSGLLAFTEVDDISIVCIPDEHVYGDIGLAAELTDHCANMGDRFAVLQAPPGPLSEEVTPVDSSYGGYYFPHIYIRDPETAAKKLVPPGGHIAGVYARTDTTRGPHKAPANETVNGAVELEFDVTARMQASLNPQGINCIRSFRGRGIRVWGARTMSSDPEWKYINVRRLFLYLEESIDESTQWVVFEPNNELLWARVRQTVSNFLTTVWRDGALMGSNPDEAFFVKCDRTTMTEDDLASGRLVVEIGVAPTKPAEFVIFRISQQTAGAGGA